jgi:uncharacterized protein with HEPN domain
MPPTLGDRLVHLLNAIENIHLALRHRSLDDFKGDLFCQAAVERFFEIMSEASRYLPREMKDQEKDIAWQQLADLGNRLRHAYHRVDPEVLWNIAHNDLDPLKRFVARIIESES